MPVRANSLVIDTLDFNIYAVTESSSGVLSASQRAGEGLTPICPHCTQSRRSLWPRGDYLMGTDRLSAPSECRAQALHCRMVADTAIDEQVRTLWISMAQTWSKLAEAMERLQLH